MRERKVRLMYNLIIPFPAKTIAPLYVPLYADSEGIEPNGDGTYTVSDWRGDEIAAGSISSISDSDLQITELTGLDGVALGLEPGTYVVEMLLPVTVTGGGGTRQYVYSVVLNVPGRREYDHIPTAADLQVSLLGARMIQNPPLADDMNLDLFAAMDTAVSAWENATGWFPFLAPTELVEGAWTPITSTRSYFPQDLQQGGGAGGGYYGSGTGWGYGGGFGGGYGATLPLRAGLLSLTSVAVAGTTFSTTGTPPVRLLPDTAPARRRPFEDLQFCGAIPWGTVGQTMDVTGVWGFCQSLPADVWNVLLGMAGGEIAPGLSLAVTGGLNSYTELGVTEAVRASPFGDAIARWSAQTSKAIGRYRRCSIA